MIRRDTLIGKITNLHWFLLLNIIAIAVFGVAILFSAASNQHDALTGALKLDPSLAIDHASRFVLFLAIAIVLSLAPLRIWAGVAYPAYFIGVIMLILVDINGVVVNGAERWLKIAGSFRLQPSELMKLALPLALARYYHQMFEAGRSKFWVHIWALAFVAIPTILVLRQPDLGTAMMIAATGLAVIFFAGIDLRIVGVVLALAATAAPVVYFFGLHGYQRERVDTMFNPASDPLGKGYQLQQGLIAIGSGGAGGKGYMEGQQKELNYIPEQRTDFIFTVPAEEFGFVGCIAILIAWGAALLQGMGIASRSGSTFGSLAGAGFVSTLTFYVVINIGMVIGLLPVVGIPLPLISYGGTVMLTVMIGFGLLMAVHLSRDQNMSLRGLL
jgi:rod shape determining protein RodA